MLDIGATELLLIVIVAVIVIGPKDLPRALRMIGQWIAKGRRISSQFTAGLDALVREAELVELEKQRVQNRTTMSEPPADASQDTEQLGPDPAQGPAPVADGAASAVIISHGASEGSVRANAPAGKELRAGRCNASSEEAY